MRGLVLFLLVVAVACAGEAEVTTTVATEAPTASDAANATEATTTSTTETTSPTSTTAPPTPCPEAPYDLAWLPPTVRPAADDDEASEPDEFTSIGATHMRLWVDSDGATAIALVRGALPPRDWPSDRGEVEVAGTRAVAGPYPDGRWVVAWFNEPGDRCDQYTMVFYPPVSPAEVEETLANMARLPG